MKRLALVVLALAAFVPSTAHAAAPCRDRIYNDWYGDGKIATTYPIACYRDALSHIRADAATYSSLSDDIRAAMQGALARLHGHNSVPAQIGKGGQGAVQPEVVKLDNKDTKTQVTDTVPVSTTASGPTSGGSSGVPTPILVLGALALLLAAIGAVGAAARRTRRR